jgi:GNAT superfamily N-acetyltransferase
MSSNSCAPASLLVSEAPLEALLGDPDFDRVRAEYAAEALPGFDTPLPDLARYRHLAAAGNLVTITARLDGRLIGFAVMLVYTVPHHYRPVARSESLFVLAAERARGAGVSLIKAMYTAAQQRNCQGLGMSVPIGASRALPRLLRMMGFQTTHEILYAPCKKLL